MTPLDTMLDARATANSVAVTRLRAARSWPPAVAAGVVVGVVVAILVNVVVGIVVAIAVAAVVGWWRWSRATAAVVSDIVAAWGARAATEAEFPRYLNLIEGLSITTGIAEPQLYVVDDAAANAAVCGAGADAALVVTTGLLEGLTRVQLEGVLAEQLARIDVGDAEAAGCCAVLALGSLLALPVSAPPSAAGAAKLARSVELFGGQRHFLADMSASSLTRYPPGLRDALIRMSGIGTSPACATWGTAHLWMCDPVPTRPGDATAPLDGGTHTDHPPIQHRIDLLAEL